ncbi:MAG: DNA polymerase III subunit delta [Bacteroidales bacterium]|jgi:DNA polymerase-3 subunit delta|nr:DNA polymerase III subunit delta [Bacteroidales bacterium]MBO7346605.1 DNA polymerase III subunit delta [Bacteroidales bacterium]MBQ4478911.1 DNA polymerase III subunit delta [Bacteroidales bacterium]MBR4452753.1 DNA polymerase III subunit delta [Bacteroidales bacterium]
MKLSYEQIMGQLKDKQYAPIILLHGEEPYFVDKITRYIQDNFFEDEGLKDFNYQLFYGKETSEAEIVANAKQFPMLSNYRLIVVREAQKLIKEKSAEKLAAIAEYAQSPQKQTVLVLSFMEGKKLDGRTALYKNIVKNYICFESERVYENKIGNYVIDIAKEKGYDIRMPEVNLLVAQVGVNLSRISNELDKLNNVVSKGQLITDEIIEKYVGISRKYNNYELKNAVLCKNYNKAFEILEYFKKNPPTSRDEWTGIIHAIIAYFEAFYILLQMYYNGKNDDLFLKMLGVRIFTDYPIYRKAMQNYSFANVVKAIHIIRQYDMYSKGGDGNETDEVELIREMTIKIINL